MSEIIDEIKGFDRRDFFFVDDNICGDITFAKELFRALIPLKMTWGAQTSITFTADDELLDLYAKSGGTYAYIGFESISGENLKDINKQWNRADQYSDKIRKIHNAGINILGSFIFGLDNDDETVFERTLDFIMENRIDAAQFHILTPFPGTRLYDKLQAEGRILEKDWAKYHTGEIVFQPRMMPPKTLEDGYYKIFRKTSPYEYHETGDADTQGIHFSPGDELQLSEKSVTDAEAIISRQGSPRASHRILGT